MPIYLAIPTASAGLIGIIKTILEVASGASTEGLPTMQAD